MLTVSVPKIRNRSNRAAEVRPSRLKAWLTGLPRGGPEESLQQILQALFVQNRTDLTPVNRLSLMEVYRAPILGLAESLAPVYAASAHPLDGREHDLASSVQRLVEELANGYKIVANDLIRKAAAKKHTDELVLALQRATHALSAVLLTCWEVYRPCPDEAWRQLHQLYRLGEIHDVLHHQVDDAALDEGPQTVFGSYERAFLLGAIDPYRLLQGECRQLFRLVATFENQLRVSPWRGDRTRQDPGDFLVNLASDSPPVPMAKLRASELAAFNSGHCRRVSALSVAREVHAMMTALQATPESAPGTGGAGPVAEADLLRRLGRALAGLSVTRHSNRSGYDREVPVCVGMNSIHYFANGQRTFSSPPTTEAAGQAPGGAANEEFFEPADAGAVGAPHREGRDDLTDLDLHAHVHRLSTCSVRDQGAGGLCIQVQGEIHLRVGDLVGLQYPTPNRWNVGAVRWMKGRGAGQLEFGVELLAPELALVAVRRATGDDGPLQALMLPGNRALRRPRTLLVPRGPFEAADKLIVSRESGEEMEVSPMAVLDRTGSYDLLMVAAPDSAEGDGAVGAAGS